jgi:hypothetical protein
LRTWFDRIKVFVDIEEQVQLVGEGEIGHNKKAEVGQRRCERRET